MISILGGLGAAACWAIATLASSRSSRMLSASSVVAWVMVVGLVIALPGVIVTGVPDGLGASSWVWLGLSGAGNVGGLLCIYAAFAHGKVGLIAPIVSTEGAVAAVIAVAAGESLGGAAAGVLAMIVVGVVLASVPPPETADLGHRDLPDAVPDSSSGDPRPTAPVPNNTIAVGLAIAAAVIFGISLYASGRVSQDLPISWVVLPPRVVGVAVVAIPLLVRGRLELTRAALPLVVLSGLTEVLGYVAYGFGSRHGIAVTAVFGSQFAALTTLGAYVLFRERLGRVQLVGVVTIAVSVATFTALRV